MAVAPGGTPVRVGIAGWSYEPWRGNFYPDGLARTKELEYASRRLSSIEINATYYRTQRVESFARWHDETPDDFVFSVKAPRYATDRRDLMQVEPAVERFFRSGVMELKDKLGPINWQFPATQTFEPDHFERFLELLPASVEGRTIRHVLEVRHQSFKSPEFIALLRRFGVAVAVADKAGFPEIADVTAGFVYVRLQRASEGIACGYAGDALDRWARRARIWTQGGTPDDMQALAEPEEKPPRERDVFVYMVNGFKPKAPAAAMALIERLSYQGPG